MNADTIEAIGIDLEGSLWVRPRWTEFPMIYREAREVGWDHAQRHLYAPKPREWSYVDWFLHILSTVRETGTELRLTPETEWVGISAELRRGLEAG